MDSNIIRTWNGKTIRQREDGYLCLTDMAQACSKLLGNWTRLKSTSEYLQALEGSIQISIDQIIEINESTGSNNERGTWGHRLLALEFARWLSPEFSIQCNKWVEELLLTGKVELSEQPKQLTSIERADKVNSLAASLQFFGYEIQNPRFKQEVHDLVGDMLGFSSHLNQQLLSKPEEIWLGVAERAEQLGYQVSLVTKNRSQLGKYVKACGLSSIKEKRLCNGTQREINLYLLTDELDIAIKEFMGAKTLAA